MASIDLLRQLQHNHSPLTALVLVEGRQERLHWSFADLQHEAQAAAVLLQQHGLGTGDQLVLIARNSPHLIALLLATLQLRCCLVPLHPDLSMNLADSVLVETTPGLLVVDAAVSSARLRQLAAKIPCRILRLRPDCRCWLREFLRHEFLGRGRARCQPEQPPSASPAEPEFAPVMAACQFTSAPAATTSAASASALLLYSSGSTGKPKGICYTRSRLNTFLHWQARLFATFPDEPSGAALSPRVNVLPLSHFGGLSFCLQALLQNRPVYLLQQHAPADYLALLIRTRCQMLLLVPSLFESMLETVRQNTQAHSLRYCLTLGEALSPQLSTAIASSFGVPVFSAYGMSEGLSGLGHPDAATQVRAAATTRHFVPPAGQGSPAVATKTPMPAGTCGRLLFGAVKLVDAAGVETSDCGELWVQNATTTPCYTDPQLNREKYHDGWYRTGDLFSCDSAGWYFYRGRADALCISNGCKAYPQEVEAVLLRHAAVADCLVAALQLGDGRQRPGALVCLKAGAQICAQQLIDFWLEHGALHATPAWILFVEALPLNANGKRDRLQAARQLQHAYQLHSAHPQDNDILQKQGQRHECGYRHNAESSRRQAC